MKQLRALRCSAATGLALLALMPKVWAEDVLKVATAQRGAWEAAAPELRPAGRNLQEARHHARFAVYAGQ